MSDRYSMVVGRFQPLHQGHKSLIDKLIAEGRKVLIAIMDTPIDADNPHDLAERITMIKRQYGDRVTCIAIPPIDSICYGRNPGYWLRRVVHGAERITATAIRTDGREPEFDYFPEFLDRYRQVAEAHHETAVQQGFWSAGSKRPIYEPIALAHSELSEALEAARLHNPPDKNISEMSAVEVQLSDVLGILMDMECGYGYKIAEALGRKMAYNRTRGYMHGGKAF